MLVWIVGSLERWAFWGVLGWSGLVCSGLLCPHYSAPDCSGLLRSGLLRSPLLNSTPLHSTPIPIPIPKPTPTKETQSPIHPVLPSNHRLPKLANVTYRNLMHCNTLQCVVLRYPTSRCSKTAVTDDVLARACTVRKEKKKTQKSHGY
ncbi:hypothetical protein P154DRAFT_352847 [Amniculicola lignicola CBS 123094]|uniref:Uncharacterized protein n=1 Tax=Amniculicola lignicola CBS 123094 TaxID=1392246 RepID=A0A6A5X0Y7_9PLEO|nr:hypothetical protein P154DRAFT_352847 [Amniculicola lignicola CBS 123094]